MQDFASIFQYVRVKNFLKRLNILEEQIQESSGIGVSFC